MLRSWYSASFFRRWLALPNAPTVVKAIHQIFRHVFAQREETEETESIPSTRKPDAELQAITGPDIEHYNRIKYRGHFYCTPSTHKGNSLVIIKPSDKAEFPAQIRYIYKHPTSQMHVVIARQMPRPAGLSDPVFFTDFPAQTFLGVFSDDLETFPLNDIKAHYAQWTLTPECSFVLSLDQVCPKL